jgi:protein phosphatase
VASQLAVQSLQLQLRGLLAEAYDESQVLPPQIIGQQLEAAIRIVNDVISNQNDAQGREERQRMGTTLALALVVPQRIQTDEGWERVDEIYIAHVGDSRAYWITPDYCHLLTVDHDIAGREVQACRQLLPIAQERPDAGALTQAIGTRGHAYLHPFIQRFLVDETGVLLLCSDGLSDNHRIEDAWANYIGLIVKDIVSLDAAVASWIELANQKNGHDNTSVVLMYCKVVGRAALVSSLTAQQEMPTQETGSMAPALLYGESREDMTGEMGKPIRDRRFWPIFAAIAALILMAGGGVVWWFLTQRSPTPVSPPSAPELEQTP